jgi:glycolate oxidase
MHNIGRQVAAASQVFAGSVENLLGIAAGEAPMTAIEFLEPRRRVLAERATIIADLAELLPEEGLVSDPRRLVPFETDAFTAYRRLPLAVALPETTAQVAAVMRYCHAKGVPVVPRGAGTSLCGGAIPQEDAVIIGLAKMNRILEINYADRLARVQAGVTNIAISNTVSDDGFFYAPDPSSQLACTIGGNIAMNSGGAHCLKYGVTTNNLLGVTLVTVEGDVLQLGGAALDAPGLDLLGLICGSEGQLGLVTEATVRLIAKPLGARPVMFGFDTAESAGDCVSAIIAAGIVPVAIEFMDRPAIQICEAFAKAGYPLDVEALLIIEVEGSDAEMQAQLGLIIAIAQSHGVKVVKESQSATEAALIWKGRKSAFGATGRIADYICMDGTVPLSQLTHVLRETTRIVAGYGLRVANVFHAGDGNMHPLILYDVNNPAEAEKAEACGMDLLRLCVDAGGCLTGEHGVGIEKRDLMLHQYSEADLKQQMRVRSAFDAGWLLNPSKVFPLEMHGQDGTTLATPSDLATGRAA